MGKLRLNWDTARCYGRKMIDSTEVCPLRQVCLRYRVLLQEMESGEGNIVSTTFPSEIGTDCKLYTEMSDEEISM